MDTKAESVEAVVAARKSAISTATVIDDLASQKEKLMVEVEKSRRTVVDNELVIENFNKELNDARTEIEELKKEKRALLEKMNEMANLIEEMEDELVKKSEELQITYEKYADSQEKLSTTRDILIKTEKTLERVQNNLISREAELARSESRKVELEGLLGGLRDRISMVENDFKVSALGMKSKNGDKGQSQ
eukprot:GDKK01044305.1.p1 GENE.GDKK01044305.1~~GDKK01044305.1.p1  ORF type:complete len:223 (-),score=69.68 GDKK01044305.1:162-734(-)